VKTVAIANVSGGRGRTSATKRLADELTNRHHKRVLIIDLDHLVGCSISSQYLTREQITTSQATVLDALLNPNTVPSPVGSSLSLFVGNTTLLAANQWFALEEKGSGVLHSFLGNWDNASQYEYCLIDCQAVLDSLTINALVAADCVLVPIWIRRSSTDFDMAETNVSLTFDAVRKLKGEQSLAAGDVGFSISKPRSRVERLGLGHSDAPRHCPFACMIFSQDMGRERSIQETHEGAVFRRPQKRRREQ